MKIVEVVAAIIRDGSNYLTVQRGYGEFEGYYEFPGGKIESGETMEDALVREIKEELEIAINVENKLCAVEYDYPNFHLIMHCFYAVISHGKIELNEHKAMIWANKEELKSVDWIPADIQVMEAILNDN